MLPRPKKVGPELEIPDVQALTPCLKGGKGVLKEGR